MNSKHLTNLAAMLFSSIFFLTSPALLFADISTDGSVGAAQTLTGPNYAIPETLGTLKGSNLFHSFDKFSIKTEESATFTGSDSIKNVISRVTGGGKSEINGTLRSNVGKADFYFINPSGVVFGENAKVDVPAAFHASTGNQLKFQDGSSFKASKSEQSTLTQAAPEAFGFLGTQSVNIKVNGDNMQNKGSIEINGSTLEFQPESKVSLTSSKEIAIKGIEKEASIGAEAKQASLTSYGGEIELKADGDLLLDNAAVDTSGNGGGKISLKAKNLTITNNSNIGSNNIGDKNAYAGVDVEVDNQLEILNGSEISSSTLSEGNAGYVKIDAGEIKIDGIGTDDYQYTGVWSDSYPDSKGNAGTVEVSVNGLLEILNGGQISSATYSTGDGNNVFINAGNLRINSGLTDKFTGIWSDTTNSGNAGTVEVSVNGLLEILNGGQISSATYSTGNGNNVFINAENLRINSGLTDKFTGIWSDTTNSGNAGTVEVSVNGLLEILNGGQISSDTWSIGDGNTVSVNADTLVIDNKGVVDQYTGIWSDAEPNSQGNAGTVEVSVNGLLEILNGGQISSATYSTGDGNNVFIKAGNLRINDNGIDYKFTGIWSDASPSSQGDAGTVDVTVSGLLELLNEGQISSDTYGEGDAGEVIVNADDIIMKNKGQISNDTYGSGNAGSIVINADKLTMNNEGYIGCGAWLNANGYVGNITINSNYIKLIDDSKINISAYQKLSEDMLLQINDQPSFIKINSKSILLNYSSIFSASLQNVPAAPTYIYTDKLIVSNESYINSVANMTDGGDINIQTQNIFLNNGVISTSVFSEAYLEQDDGSIISLLKGDGGSAGDISIKGADFMVMHGGYIKANTVADNKYGGDIYIDVKNVIADKAQEFKIGGTEIIDLEAGLQNLNMNLIQAVAPTGVDGDINISGVELDIGGSIINASSQFSTQAELATDPCRAVGTEHASSLIQKSRGGFTAMPSSPSSIYFIDKRFDELMMYEKNSEQQDNE